MFEKWDTVIYAVHAITIYCIIRRVTDMMALPHLIGHLLNVS
jgi:hypothetical protein